MLRCSSIIFGLHKSNNLSRRLEADKSEAEEEREHRLWDWEEKKKWEKEMMIGCRWDRHPRKGEHKFEMRSKEKRSWQWQAVAETREGRAYIWDNTRRKDSDMQAVAGTGEEREHQLEIERKRSKENGQWQAVVKINEREHKFEIQRMRNWDSEKRQLMTGCHRDSLYYRLEIEKTWSAGRKILITGCRWDRKREKA
jgi:hypothetical protein